MPFEKGKSGNPNGRPKGVRDKRTAARELLEPHIPDLVQKAVDMALQGDTAALRICIDRCIPALKTVEQTVDVELTPNGEPREISGRILNRMYHGEIDPETAQKMINAIARKISIDELAELYERLEFLERQWSKAS